jgi:methionyl-tRNA synthetase
MLTRQLGGRLGSLDLEGTLLVQKLVAAKDQIVRDYEGLNYATVVRTINALADEANRYIEQKQPWSTIKTDAEQTRTTLTAVLNAMRVLTIYLKPILPKFAGKVEKFLNVGDLSFADVERTLENREIGTFERLFERIDEEHVNAMIEESKEGQAPKPPVAPQVASPAPAAQPAAAPQDVFKPECTIDDFAKLDLRIARVVSAERVQGADKLLRLVLNVGSVQKTVMAGIAQAYKPEDLVGRLLVYFANLKPRQMKFGLSEGMILASGSGGKDVFLLSVDPGASPGQKVS